MAVDVESISSRLFLEPPLLLTMIASKQPASDHISTLLGNVSVCVFACMYSPKEYILLLFAFFATFTMLFSFLLAHQQLCLLPLLKHTFYIILYIQLQLGIFSYYFILLFSLMKPLLFFFSRNSL